jgi:hypothetical protein
MLGLCCRSPGRLHFERIVNVAPGRILNFRKNRLKVRKLQQEIGPRVLLGCSSSRTTIKLVAEVDFNGEYIRFAYYFKGNYQSLHTPTDSWALEIVRCNPISVLDFLCLAIERIQHHVA